MKPHDVAGRERIIQVTGVDASGVGVIGLETLMGDGVEDVVDAGYYESGEPAYFYTWGVVIG